jgi:predicted ATP-grasp superfamily ATP-dependent carboligase
VEFIRTALGIKIIDVNPRAGGYYNQEWIRIITGVSTFEAEVILCSNLEYFGHPLASSRSISGRSVFSERELAEELSRRSTTAGQAHDVRVFRVQDPAEMADATALYASVYEVTDSLSKTFTSF